MVNLLNGFKIRAALPLALALILFITIDLPTYASATTNLSISRPKLFSALAIAEFKTLRTSLDILFLEKVN